MNYISTFNNKKKVQYGQQTKHIEKNSTMDFNEYNIGHQGQYACVELRVASVFQDFRTNTVLICSPFCVSVVIPTFPCVLLK